ncbi:AAA family ATPase [Nostoc sp. UHCC 0702]|nr:AAA family ATPase [Nostoc sp. UHCC 0702]
MTKNIILAQNWENSEYRETLSENQLQAFDLIHKWYLNRDEARTPFVLKGYAGTGKTYCIQRVIKSLQQCFRWDNDYSMKPIKVAMCAPTHKARNVLEVASANAGLSVHIATLHSLCHLMPGDYDENGKQGMKINSYSNELHYQDFDLVIVDESSMIGEEILLFMPYMQIPTIFMGDPAQLPPVSDDDEQQESPVFTMPSIGLELTQVQRYSGAIADYVYLLRSDISAERIPRLENGNNLTKYNTETWLQHCLDSFRLKRGNTKALCWTNKRVASLNESIRSYILADADEFEIGEQLFCKEPIIKKSAASTARRK